MCAFVDYTILDSLPSVEDDCSRATFDIVYTLGRKKGAANDNRRSLAEPHHEALHDGDGLMESVLIDLAGKYRSICRARSSFPDTIKEMRDTPRSAFSLTPLTSSQV